MSHPKFFQLDCLLLHIVFCQTVFQWGCLPVSFRWDWILVRLSSYEILRSFFRRKEPVCPILLPLCMALIAENKANSAQLSWVGVLGWAWQHLNWASFYFDVFPVRCLFMFCHFIAYICVHISRAYLSDMMYTCSQNSRLLYTFSNTESNSHIQHESYHLYDDSRK